MRFLASLDAKDRRMLLIILGLVAVLLVVFAVLTPPEDPNRSTVPDSYLTGRHGAKAAFTLLEQSGYTVQRWEQPLGELAKLAGLAPQPSTQSAVQPGSPANIVLILADPNAWDLADRRAVATILRHGGRVLATGLQGGLLLPGNEVTLSRDIPFAACEAQPDGLQPLAGPGPIWIVPRSAWKESRPEIRTAYTCAGQPVVVEYPVGKGTAVWWASSTPLENASIARGQNLELLLNSIGPAQGGHIYWDESLHAPPHSQWDYVRGPVWPLLSLGALGLTLLVIFSYSRRSGPVRPLPQAPRTTPIEFLDALGALYRSTGAAATAVEIAWERFRTQSALLTGQRISPLDARQIAAAIERRFGPASVGMEAGLIAAEEACGDEKLKPRRALALIQTLRRHEETLRGASARTSSPANIREAGAPSLPQFHGG